MANVEDDKVELLENVEDVGATVKSLGLASETYKNLQEFNSDQKHVNEVLEILKYETDKVEK